MFNEFLKKNINQGPYATEIPKMVQYGFGQVEPNHLSAQRTSQVYAQLPADPSIEVLQQGQFVKYDYASGLVNFGSEDHDTGEWMLVYNEIKLYRDFQDDCEFALIKDNYRARVYSPFGGQKYAGKDVGINGVLDGNDWAMTDIGTQKQSRYFAGRGAYTIDETTGKQTEIATNGVYIKDGKVYAGTDATGIELGNFEKVTTRPDYYEMHYNEDPFHIYGLDKELKMPDGTAMVPRVLKTNVGDIFTTNTVDEYIENIRVGKTLLTPGTKGILTPLAQSQSKDGIMLWQVVKIYTMPDHQPGVKIMRVQ